MNTYCPCWAGAQLRQVPMWVEETADAPAALATSKPVWSGRGGEGRNRVGEQWGSPVRGKDPAVASCAGKMMVS